MKPIQLFIYSLLIAAFSSACSQNSRTDKNAQAVQQDSSYVVDVIAADYAFGMPNEIPSGWVTFRMENMGMEEHLGIINKYPDSLGYEGVVRMTREALAQEGMNGFYPLLGLREKQYGGPAMLSPGLTGETTVHLEPGVYALNCWVVTEDGEYHMQRGMTRPFTVTDKSSGAEKPETTTDIAVSSFDITIKDPIAAGDHTFNVDFGNSHNVHLAKLEEDTDLEMLKEWMNSIRVPSPVTFLGGAEQGVEGTSSTFKATLEPGRYAFLTFGLAIHGMVEEIYVPESGAAPASTSAKPTNAAIQIESDVNDTILPETIQTGRTPIVVKNTGSVDYAINLFRMKEGKSAEDFKTYFEAVNVYRTAQREPGNAPYYSIPPPKVVPAGEQIELTLTIDESQYVILPILMTGSLEEAWRDGNIVHSMQGVSK